MKNIYHIHQSSNSYWDSRWTDTDYYLCDSEDEYQQKLAEYTEKRKQIEKEFKENPTELSKSRALFLQLSKEQKVHASEYYYGHEWCGRELHHHFLLQNVPTVKFRNLLYPHNKSPLLRPIKEVGTF